MARKRKPPARPAWTPNQIVAHNISKARLLRRWTQDQAAEACGPYLGTRMSAASWSALERSVDGGRIREITADELVAFARAFDLPIGFFLTPPTDLDDHVVATPDAGPEGLEPIELFDVVIGTDDNLAEWERYLRSWPSFVHRVVFHPDRDPEFLGRDDADVHPRLAGPAALRAQLLLQQHFGDLDQARHVLTRLAAVLDDLAQPEAAPDDTEQQSAARRVRRQKEEDSR